MVWEAISWRGLGPLVTLHGKIKGAYYVNILGDQVHPFVQTSFPGECPLYQDDNAPIHTAKIVQEWFAEHEGEVGHLDWPPQSPNLNTIEHFWGYLESKLRARFPPPSTILALETALHEEWLHIPLQVVHDLYASIPRRIQSVIQSKGVQLPINKAFLLFHRAISEKKKVIESVEEGERKVDAAKAFEIPLSSLSTILKNKEKIFCASSSRVRKRVSKGNFPRLEQY
ncbi:transposable element Tcb2 transposase [Trichonephila clavipes]|nr:transposable element Tcb2 transposase [Trichonephila clavipes]